MKQGHSGVVIVLLSRLQATKPAANYAVEFRLKQRRRTGGRAATPEVPDLAAVVIAVIRGRGRAPMQAS